MVQIIPEWTGRVRLYSSVSELTHALLAVGVPPSSTALRAKLATGALIVCSCTNRG